MFSVVRNNIRGKQEHRMNRRLISIPRVASTAPNKNTIEWAIPNKVKVVFMLIERTGYTIIISVKVEKKHCWNSSYKTFTISSPNPADAIMKGLEFLEKHGYYIEHNTIAFEEEIGLEFETKNVRTKKSSRSLIEFNQAEIKDRTEWLFWECFNQTGNNLDNLRSIFQIDESDWTKVRNQLLYETLLWAFGQSIAVLRGVWNRKLSEEDIEGIVIDLIYFLEILFPPHKNYEIIAIFSNYVIASEDEEDHKKLRDEIESYYIERICHLLNSDYHKFNHQEIRDFIFSKFPWGWVLALDAFTEIPINDIKTSNLTSRQYFRKELLEAKDRADRGESAEEAQKRRKWEENVDEFNKLVGNVSDDLNDEINRRSDLEK